MGDLAGPGVLTRVLKRWEREAGAGRGREVKAGAEQSDPTAGFDEGPTGQGPRKPLEAGRGWETDSLPELPKGAQSC